MRSRLFVSLGDFWLGLSAWRVAFWIFGHERWWDGSTGQHDSGVFLFAFDVVSGFSGDSLATTNVCIAKEFHNQGLEKRWPAGSRSPICFLFGLLHFAFAFWRDCDLVQMGCLERRAIHMLLKEWRQRKTIVNQNEHPTSCCNALSLVNAPFA